MRLVRWESQERVDLPDMTAMSFLVLGEFRKTIRDVLLGFDTGGSDKFILRGFEVEPSAVPDTRIRVRMDTGDADRIGTALLSENLGANTEFGQLLGGEDSAAALEGQAQQILDFAGQPVATYVVEMRFVPYTSSTGANDNRAFWNPGINSEFIASTDTRFEPQWEIQFVGAATGGEWIPLADVVWDGVGPITTTEITDTREFAYEGTAGAFDATSQAGPGGMADFDRTATRGDLTVGVNEVYRVLRAHGRQIQDIKGQDASGNFNSYARPAGPIDPAASGVPATLTRSLRTVDTVTYTVGDGDGSFGDFNGVSGLEEALDALANGATRPRRAKIVIKASNRANITYAVTNTYDFTAAPGNEFTLEIVAESVNGVSEGDDGRAAIDFSGAGGATGTVQAKKLILRNLACAHTTAQNTLFAVEQCEIHDCVLATPFDAADLTGGFYALAVDRQSTRSLLCVTDSDFTGPVKVVDTSSAPLNRFEREGQGVFRNCSFTSPIVLHDFLEAAGSTHVHDGLLFEGCTMQSTVSRTNQRGVIDGGFARNVTLRFCQITLSDREYNGLHIAEQVAGTPPGLWNIENCTFRVSDTARTSLVDAGQFGNNGTGWAIFILQTNVPAPEDIEEAAANFRVSNCYFEGPASVPTNNDSGAIYVAGTVTTHIEDNTFWHFSAPAGGRSRVVEFRGVKVDAGIVVRGNHISKFLQGTATSELVGVYVNDCNGANITENTIIGERDTGGVLTLSTTLSAGVEVRDSNDVNVHHNRFKGWPVESVIGIERVALGGVRYCKFDHNVFDYSGIAGGYCIDFSNNAVEWCSANGNTILIGTTGRGINGGSCSDCVINSNVIDMNASSDPNGIDFDASTADCMCSGNRVDGGIIAGAGAGVVYGFQNSARNDLNFFP